MGMGSLISSSLVMKLSRDHGLRPPLYRRYISPTKIIPFSFTFQSYYYKDNDWIFVCKFKVPVAARYLQFLCDETSNATCLDRLTISGCAVGKGIRTQ